MSKKQITIDIETTGLNFKTDKILCCGVKINDEDTLYFDQDQFIFNSPTEKLFFPLIRDNRDAEFIFHNGSFDTKFLRANGFPLIKNTHDTMIMASLLKDRPKKLSLDALASYYLGLPSWKEDLDAKSHLDIYNDPEDERRELLEIYVKQDVDITKQVFDALTKKLIEEDRYEFYLKVMKARRMLTDAEFCGIMFDKSEANKLIKDYTYIKCDKLTHLDNLYPYKVNWRSPKQVLSIFKELGLDVIDPITKKESVGKRVQLLNKDKHPVANTLFEYKQTDKKITTLKKYIEEKDKGLGVINANFNMTNVRTGRLSSSGPNLQQVDSSDEIRRLFTVPKHKRLIVGDLAQIEVRMAAHYSQDPSLIKTFKDEVDFYGVIAQKTLGYNGNANDLKKDKPQVRDIAKVIGLSILYGCGVNRLRNGIKESTDRDIGYTGAKKIITDYFNGFSGLKTLRKQVDRVLTERGFIKNLYGRKIDISEKDIYMTGVNSLLQSSASDLLLFRVTEFMEKFGGICDVLALVHDEVLIECDEDTAEYLKEELIKIMERTDDIKFRVPLKFEANIGTDWSVK